MIDKDLAARLKSYRNFKHLTQKEVADKMGISQSYISRLEKRIIEKMRQDIEQLVKIA